MLEQLECVCLVGVLRRHDNADAWVERADGVGRPNSFHMMTRRHADVSENSHRSQTRCRFAAIDAFGAIVAADAAHASGPY
jgi:hypothetical protein